VHYNKNLPPVGIKLLVKEADTWHLVTRSKWANRNTEFVDFNGVDKIFTLNIKRGNIKWMYP
tara:strand:+ start:677 stop:862 length:186 start_codon:yes stop_codon:yes gene_type:complete